VIEDEFQPDFVGDSLSEQRERERLDRELADERRREDQKWWTAALSTKVGRRCIWERLQAAGTFRRGSEHFAMGPGGVPADRATDYHMGAHDYGRQWWEWLLAVETELAILMRVECDPSYAAFRRDRLPEEPGPVRPA
jgi:hypothetical protein